MCGCCSIQPSNLPILYQNHNSMLAIQESVLTHHKKVQLLQHQSRQYKLHTRQAVALSRPRAAISRPPPSMAHLNTWLLAASSAQKSK